MISIKFECPHCQSVNDFHLFYNLNFRLCDFKGFGICAEDSFVANCENCKKEVEFLVEITQLDNEDSVKSAGVDSVDIREFFLKKARRNVNVARKVGISKQSVSYFIKNRKADKSARVGTILLYRLLFNAKSEVIDYLLDDDNFDINQKIKDSK